MIMDTQLNAYQKVMQKFDKHKAIILRYIEKNPKVTDQDVSDGTGIDPITSQARCSDLLRLGLIEDSGVRGKSRAGNPKAKWIVSDNHANPDWKPKLTPTQKLKEIEKLIKDEVGDFVGCHFNTHEEEFIIFNAFDAMCGEILDIIND